MPGECHCPAPILLCCLATTPTFTPSFPHCHSWGLWQLRRSGHFSADTRSPVAFFVPRRVCPCHDSPRHFPMSWGRMERHQARGCDGKGSPHTITSLNLKENSPGSPGWRGCQNKKHSLTEHPAAQQERGTDPIPSETSSDGRSLPRYALQITSAFVDK